MPVKGSLIASLKSRSGCKTCKARRVKCGEEKPNCNRCTSTGRKCEYECTVSGATLYTISPSSFPNTAWRERRAFAYYFQHAASFVGGGLDGDFWRTIVPQVCRSEPAVWDAIISISALFEGPEPFPDFVSLRPKNPGILTQNHRDALDWYSRSVTSVRQHIERGAMDVFVGLISCVLFISIESLQGATTEALQLYEQGVHLILALRAQVASGAMPPAKAFLLEDIIVPIFVRLGAIAFTASGAPVASLLPETEHVLTQEFVSLKSARDAIVLLSTEAQLLESICEEHVFQTSASHVPLELINRQMILSAKLKSWHVAFTKLMASLHSKGSLSPEQSSTAALLWTYHETVFIILETCISPSQVLIDAYLPNFQTIVEQSSIALDAYTQPDGTQPPFTFEISVGLPIWFTCLRCREAGIRRMALDLLRRAPQVQGVYKLPPVVTFGEKVIMLEETYGSAINEAQEMTNSTTPGSTDALVDYLSHSRGKSSDVSSPTDMSTEVLVPEEARIKPIGVFRPREGIPPVIREEDVAKWNADLDQDFLRFSRNKYDMASDTWQVVHECVPIDF
ncbi:hypothetical protein SI65_09052 [Aspergillus cristatus]|uniref:Zn(2)-C6 fungal-type domain-containing protein n=1 Tax=Aspergillus cristatus TaxID=573508 RepID=A0A1E3B3F1_ASPCR|nr:hypothetical protein SI65_09052 [Aspergillus cristatus]